MVRAGDSLHAACAAIERQLAAAGCPDAAFDAADLCLLVTGENARTAPFSRLLGEAEARRLNAVAVRRAAREPLQYIWGCWPFLNFEVKVGKGVLCPRADTEIVVELAAQRLQGATRSVAALAMQSGATPCQEGVGAKSADACPPAPQVLELCGGSGCIGLGIKMFCPTAQVTVLEKSKEALPYLYENAVHALDGVVPAWAKNQVLAEAAGVAQPSAYLKVVEGDLFEYHATLPDAAFDLLISNPPYLTLQEMTELQPEVAREPAMALVAGADGLDFYRAIATDYQRVVTPGGSLVLEIGCAQAAQVSALLAAAGWQEISCHQDYGKNDRCIIARRP